MKRLPFACCQRFTIFRPFVCIWKHRRFRRPIGIFSMKAGKKCHRTHSSRLTGKGHPDPKASRPASYGLRVRTTGDWHAGCFIHLRRTGPAEKRLPRSGDVLSPAMCRNTSRAEEPRSLPQIPATIPRRTPRRGIFLIVVSGQWSVVWDG